MNYFRDSSTATATETVIPTMGERPAPRQWREEGGERVAAVGVQRRYMDTKAHTGNRNRGSNACIATQICSLRNADCNLTMVRIK